MYVIYSRVALELERSEDALDNCIEAPHIYTIFFIAPFHFTDRHSGILVGIIVAEIVSLKINTAKVSGMIKQFELEQREAKKRREEAEEHAKEDKVIPNRT